ncbi:MFS transporter [Thalassovita sp.]|uniref:MFS transporter n=1 Tax=Thalassovita sp. TaxID=1979401 RepID=UPI00288118DD|nr:MFS transporter [Thalassovita sp.]MDF1801275.1 MFS transporter [Thalassovita sp.]
MRVFRRPVPLLTAAIGVIGANSLVLPPIAPAVAADLSTDISIILRAAAAYGGGTALSALLLAPRADVIGSDKALKGASLILVIALFLSTFAMNISMLIVGQALAGIGSGIALPSIYSLAAQVAPPGREKQTISAVLTGWTLSLIGGVTLSTVLTDIMGWRFVYGLMTLMTLGIWMLLRHCDMTPARLSSLATSPLTALRVPGIWRALLSNAMLMLAFNGAYIYMGAHVVENLQRGTSAAGAITMFYGAGFGIAVFFHQHLHRLPLRRVGLIAFGGLAVIYLLMDKVALYFYLLLPIAIIWGVLQHFALSMVVDRLTNLDITQRGAIMGLNSAVTYLTVVLGAICYRFPYEYGGLSACLAFSALFAAIAAIESQRRPRVKTYSAAE